MRPCWIGTLKGTHKEGFGRSRGGFTSKIHARAAGRGRPLGFVLTGEEVSDYKAVPVLLDLPITQPKMMLADKGYHGDDVRSSLLMHGILPVIPAKANRKALKPQRRNEGPYRALFFEQ